MLRAETIPFGTKVLREDLFLGPKIVSNEWNSMLFRPLLNMCLFIFVRQTELAMLSQQPILYIGTRRNLCPQVAGIAIQFPWDRMQVGD